MRGQSLDHFFKIISDPKKLMFFQEMGNLKDIKKNKPLAELFKNYFKTQLTMLQANLGSGAETNEREVVPELLCLFAFSLKIFQNENKEIWKGVWGLQNKMLVMYLHQHVCYGIGQFLNKYCQPKKVYSSINPKNLNQHIKGKLGSDQVNFSKNVAYLYKRVLTWLTNITSSATTLHVFNNPSASMSKALERRIKLIEIGVRLANQIQGMLRDAILLRYKLGFAVNAGMKPGILMLINMSKKVEEVINGRDIQMMHDFIIKYLGLQLSKTMVTIIQKLQAAKSRLPGKEFLSAVYKMKYSALKRYPTHQRMMIMDLCSDFFKVKGVLKEVEYQNFSRMYARYKLICNYKEIYKTRLSCSFSYWIRDMMSDFLDMMSKSDGEYFRLQIFLNSLEDSKDLLNNSIHLNSPTELIDEYRDLVVKYMNDSFMKRLSNQINDDLLYQSHHFYMVYQLEKPDPFKEYAGDIDILMKLKNVVVLDRIVNVKELAELSLAEKFYNMVSYNEKNFKMYEVMRSLAKLKYGLEVGHSYMPAKSLEQGKTDILGILRKFGLFTKTFRYNMFNQSFIEVLGDGSRLKAISIQHISDSIGTHGLGVINTSVDVVYKFIKMRINNFSQMMLDETLRSYLLREHRWLEKKKYKDGDVDQKYPLTRGQKFTKELSLASVREKGFNMIEKFRLLITVLGNALAFARILRTASFNYLSKNIEYIPFIEETECSFGDTAKVLNYASTSQDCCKALDKLIDVLRENFSQNTDFLRVRKFTQKN